MADQKMKKYRKKDYLRFLLTAVVLIILLRITLYDGLTVKTYTIDSPYTENEHTFVVIADHHSSNYGKGQETLVSKIDEISPEAIFFVGDIGDNHRDFDNTAALLEAIADKYPCYYVPGNHERWVDYTDDIRDHFESYGVTSLSGESVDLGDGIVLHGIDDPRFYPSEVHFEVALGTFRVSNNTFDILLSHRPEYAERYADLGFDLTLCGHAHGGQVILPYIINGLYAPNQGFFPRWAGGEYTFGPATVIVSRGLMKNELPRVFNPPELVVVKIT